jgi:hypothetical protein
VHSDDNDNEVDENEKVDYFIPGDLVLFTGHLYTPDYVYVDQYDRQSATIGVVLDSFSYGNYEKSIMYRVYWFRDMKITENVAGHLRLAYTRHLPE